MGDILKCAQYSVQKDPSLVNYLVVFPRLKNGSIKIAFSACSSLTIIEEEMQLKHIVCFVDIYGKCAPSEVLTQNDRVEDGSNDSMATIVMLMIKNGLIGHKNLIIQNCKHYSMKTLHKQLNNYL